MQVFINTVNSKYWDKRGKRGRAFLWDCSVKPPTLATWMGVLDIFLHGLFLFLYSVFVFGNPANRRLQSHVPNTGKPPPELSAHQISELTLFPVISTLQIFSATVLVRAVQRSSQKLLAVGVVTKFGWLLAGILVAALFPGEFEVWGSIQTALFSLSSLSIAVVLAMLYYWLYIRDTESREADRISEGRKRRQSSV